MGADGAVAPHNRIAPLVWIDVETTGLDVNTDRILEIALMATDGDLIPWSDETWETVKPLEIVIAPRGGFDIGTLNPVVVDMHSKSGLFTDISQSGVSADEAGQQIEAWLLNLVSKAGVEKALMAGSTVGQFDRQFFRRAFPDLDHSFFEYRVVDVSSVKEIVRRWYGPDALYDGGEKAHRALADIYDSILELRHYREEVFRTETRSSSLSI